MGRREARCFPPWVVPQGAVSSAAGLGGVRRPQPSALHPTRPQSWACHSLSPHRLCFWFSLLLGPQPWQSLGEPRWQPPCQAHGSSRPLSMPLQRGPSPRLGSSQPPFRMVLSGGVLHGHVPVCRARDPPHPRGHPARSWRWDLVLHHAEVGETHRCHGGLMLSFTNPTLGLLDEGGQTSS